MFERRSFKRNYISIFEFADFNVYVYTGGHLLFISGKADSPADGIATIQTTLQDGTACAKFQAMLVAQGVLSSIAERLCQSKLDQVDDVWKVLERAAYTTELQAEQCGTLTHS